MSNSIPLAHLPLSSEQAEVMLQRQIKKHHVAVILVHWFNAITWVLEVSTGIALIASPTFRIAPDWYIAMFTSLFGGRANLLAFHIALGLTWIFALLPYAVFGFRHYLRAEMLKTTDRDDMRWLFIRTLQILGKTKEPLPPQGIYNAGQKAFSMVVWFMTPVVMITGIIMAFQLFSPLIVGWAVALHFLAVGLIVSGLVIHVYMGAIFPEERPAFFSMITGTVNELYAYNHHFKWWREVKVAQCEWDQKRRSESVDESAPPPEDKPSEGSPA